MPPSLPSQVERFIAIHARYSHNSGCSHTHTTTGADVLPCAGGLACAWNVGCTIVGSCSTNLETCVFIPVQENISQTILQDKLQETVRRGGSCPAIFLIMVNQKPMCFSRSLEMLVVVGSPSGTILHTLDVIVVVYHLMQKSGTHFLNGSCQGSSTNVDFMGSSQFGNPGVFSQGEVSISSWGGLNGDGGSCKCRFKIFLIQQIKHLNASSFSERNAPITSVEQKHRHHSLPNTFWRKCV